ncbi:hypothetical protein pipiens_015971 [Culex pipiens pipiens]|uniref:Mitochondrial ribosomal protein S21 n=1 Tax=Culex pipiens pipiens TaxID=38569 RepID=A0ABD1CN76_CULPP
MRHAKFIARTVLVQNNNIEEACRVLNRILGKEEIFDQFRRTRFYEKPFQTRRRVNFERCKAIYNEDMNRKIQFVLRKNRVDPFPGCHEQNQSSSFRRGWGLPFCCCLSKCRKKRREKNLPVGCSRSKKWPQCPWLCRPGCSKPFPKKLVEQRDRATSGGGSW